MKDYVLMVSMFVKGDLVYELNGKKESILVDGGVLEVLKNMILVFVEVVVW